MPRSPRSCGGLGRFLGALALWVVHRVRDDFAPHAVVPDLHLAVLPGVVQVLTNFCEAERFPAEAMGEVFALIEDAYSARGLPDEWRRHHQGGLIGYLGREVFATPGDPTPIPGSAAVAWNPSITGGAKSEDTALVSQQGVEVITRTWELPEFEFGPHGSSRNRRALAVDDRADRDRSSLLTTFRGPLVAQTSMRRLAHL